MEDITTAKTGKRENITAPRLSETAGTLIRLALSCAIVFGALMVLSESEDLTLTKFIIQKAAGLAIIIAARFAWKRLIP